MTIGIISHPDCLLHDMGHFLPEVPDRLHVIEDEIKRSSLAHQLKKFEAPKASLDQLFRVHDEEYIAYILESSPKKGFFCLDPDTWMNPYTLNAAFHAAGAVIYAVDLVMQGEIHSAFCNVRPPGHHAERDKAMGFCIFNNVAVGVAHALERYQLNRVAIIDFDVHHGNGTEDIFKNEKRVLLCSSFEHPFYPYTTPSDPNNKHIIHIPLTAGTGGDVFRKKVEEYWLGPVRDFKPEMLFFSAGFDAYYKDPLANLMFKEEDYLWITQEMAKIANSVCQGRMVSTLEGGYALEGLGSCVVAHLCGLEDVSISI